jgi:carboxylesterase
VIDVVCLHGLGGTPDSVAPVTDALRAAGWDVAAPLLPGHGTQAEDLLGLRWEDWLAAVPDARIALGQSFGGTLALAARPTHGIVVINAVGFADPDAVVQDEWIEAGAPDIRKPDVSERAYERLPAEALREMLHGAASLDLATIAVPVLVVTSADDAITDPYHSDVIATSVAGRVERLRLPRSGHVATLDLDAPLLIDAVLDFVRARLDRPMSSSVEA